MDYKAYIQLEEVHFKITSSYIEYKTLIIQISNIVTTDIYSVITQFNEPEPQFTENQPGFTLNLISTLIISLLLFFIGYYYFYLEIGLIFFFISIAIFATIAFNEYKSELSEWQVKLDAFQYELDIWKNLKANPPRLYKLSIVTNAAIAPIDIYFYEYVDIAAAVKKIQMAMQHTGEALNETIRVIKDQTNDFLSKIPANIYVKMKFKNSNVITGNNNTGNTMVWNQQKQKKIESFDKISKELQVLIDSIDKNYPETIEKVQAIGNLKAAEISAREENSSKFIEYMKCARDISIKAATEYGLEEIIKIFKDYVK